MMATYVLKSAQKIQIVFKVISYSLFIDFQLALQRLTSAGAWLNIKADDILERGDYFRGPRLLRTFSEKNKDVENKTLVRTIVRVCLCCS